MNNVKIGNKTEKNVISILRERGYWVYNTAHKINGQPIDIIAIRGGENPSSWLLDGKHVREESPSFPLSRVEPNQWSTMLYARGFANIKNLGFAVQFDRTGEIYWLSFDKALDMKEKNIKSIKLNDLKTFEETLDEHNNK